MSAVHPIRSFVLRQGRITGAQRRAYEELLPVWGIPYRPQPLDLEQAFGRAAPRVLEIGFGMGEGTAAIAAAHPENDYPTSPAATPPTFTRRTPTTPWWKSPIWWWTRRFDAWPFSPEWLSGMFDVNAAPFFQSLVEVAFEPSAGRIRLLPHGIHGRLRWSDLQMSGTLRPPGVPEDAFAEWIVDMPGADPAARQ